jgi:UDP-N-acetylglucosamine--N-acetylmuramyl-(pentapeptide) pyrophosphoryl-undecaprenol N-acetylglucosamine transferase
VPAAGYPIELLRVSGLDRRNPLGALGAVAQAARSVPRARRFLRAQRADAVLGGGGYVAGPAGLAAAIAGVPLVLTEADSHLGLSNRWLARLARRVCLAFPIPGRDDPRYVVTGRPVPRAVLEADRVAARRRFGLGGEDRCVLVFGGSQGARSVNLAAVEAFGGDRDRDFSVLHLSGTRDFSELTERLGELDPEKYLLLESEPNLGDVLAACDLVVARAGGSIFEVAAAGRPAILVPYPFGSGDHQTGNAEAMAAAGAARVIADADLDAARLRVEVSTLLSRPDELAAMGRASAAFARPDAAERIADEVMGAVG